MGRGLELLLALAVVVLVGTIGALLSIAALVAIGLWAFFGAFLLYVWLVSWALLWWVER